MSSDSHTQGNERRTNAAVDAICDRFELAWRAGQRPRLEDYLAEAAAQPYVTPRLLRQLLLAEWDLKQAEESAIDAANYVHRFPEDTGLIRDAFAEWRAERKEMDKCAGPSVPEGTWHSDGPHIRCPHCGALVQLDGEGSLSDVVCGSCRGHFRLTGRGATTESGRLVGHFELRKQLGMGAFGVVWEAFDTQLDRTVAVKIPRRHELSNEEVEKFLREARAVAQLRHPHILSVHEVGRDGDTVYIVSELVRGESLGERLKGHVLSIKGAAQLCAKIAAALHHAHENGVIHRDLKPSNIMLDEEGEPHLMDFGLARREAGEVTMTMDGHVLGTPAYMSPEQARGEAHQADRRADIYSLGVILFESLTGELPFRGNLRILLHQVLHEEAPSPRKFNSRIPKDLETICLKCLEKEPDKRYGTAKEVAAELRHTLEGEPIRARPISPMDRGVRWCRRNPVPAALVSVLVALAVGGPILAVTQTRLRLAADRAIETANDERYISDMNLAAQAWNAGDLRRTQELLQIHGARAADDVSPTGQLFAGRKGFEWRLLWGLAHADQAAWKLVPGTGSVTCTALAPTANELVCGCADGSVIFFEFEFDRQTDRQPRQSMSLASRVVKIAYSNEGRWLAAACDDGNIQVWEAGSWHEKIELPGHEGSIHDLVFHPDGTHLTSIDDDKIRIWDLGDIAAVKVSDLPESNGRSLTISADATMLAIHGRRGGATGVLDNTVQFWRLEAGAPPVLTTLPAQQAIILSVVLSSDGSTAFISTHDSGLSRWDLETLRRTVTYSQDVLARNLVLSADGQTLVSAGTNNLIRVWESESGRKLQTLRGHPGAPFRVAISADATSLAAVSRDGTLRVRSIGSENKKDKLPHEGIVVFLAVSPDGQTLATADPNHRIVKLWDVPSRKLIDTLDGKQALAFSPDGKWLASMSFAGRLRLWDRSTTPYRLQTDKEVGSFAYGRVLNFSRDSKMLAFHGQNNVALWDVEKQQPIRELPKHAGACPTSFGPGDKVIATASNGRIRIWDVASGHLMSSIPVQDNDVREIGFSSNGKLLVATSGNTELEWWDVTDLTEPRELPPLRGHTARIGTVAFSPDGTMLATGGYDNTLRLWDVASERQLVVLRGHSSVIQTLAWSPDGNTIYTGSGDASCRIWHAPSWTKIEKRGNSPFLRKTGRNREGDTTKHKR